MVLLDNAIRFTIMNAIKDKSTDTYRDITTHFAKKVSTQEEIVTLELFTHKHNWKLGERISYLENELTRLSETEVSNE